MPVSDKGIMNFIKRIIVQLLIGANVMAACLLLLCGLSTMMNPADYPRVALFGLGFPLLLALNLTFVFLWLVFSPRRVWIALVGMLCSGYYIYQYFPLNWPKKAPEQSLKLITYNTEYLGNGEVDEAGNSPVIDYLTASEADIICLQEVVGRHKLSREELDAAMAVAGYATLHVGDGRPEQQMVYSRLPLLSIERLPYGSGGNGSVAVRLLYEGDTLLLVNNHLESYKLTINDKLKYKEIITEPGDDKAEQRSRELINKMAVASQARGPQVDSVLHYVVAHNCKSVIVCGDFNESPISYSCYRMNQTFRNAFVESGNGLGLSYYQKGFYFRIDHVYISDDWESYDTHVDKSATWSDHYPLVTYLKKRPKVGGAAN